MGFSTTTIGFCLNGSHPENKPAPSVEKQGNVVIMRSIIQGDPCGIVPEYIFFKDFGARFAIYFRVIGRPINISPLQVVFISAFRSRPKDIQFIGIFHTGGRKIYCGHFIFFAVKNIYPVYLQFIGEFKRRHRVPPAGISCYTYDLHPNPNRIFKNKTAFGVE